MKYLILLVFLSSCYGMNKAKQQTSKALNKYPIVVADIARNAFPCIPNELDSTEYNESIVVRDSLINTLSLLDVQNTEKLKEYLNKTRLDALSIQNCSTILDSAYRYIEKIEEQNQSLKDAVQKLKNLPAPKPIVQKIEDSAKIFMANQVAYDAIVKAAKWETKAADFEAKYNAEHDLRVELEKRQRGKLMIPWWIIIVIVAGAGAGFYFKRFF